MYSIILRKNYGVEIQIGGGPGSSGGSFGATETSTKGSLGLPPTGPKGRFSDKKGRLSDTGKKKSKKKKLAKKDSDFFDVGNTRSQS